MMKVSYVSEAEAMRIVPHPLGAMISITGPLHLAELPSTEAWGAFLRVQFSDAEYDAAVIARREQADTETVGSFWKCLQRIHRIGVGPIPVGSIFLLLLLYVIPLVVVWNAIDYLPRWFDKVALACLGIYAYGAHLGRKDRGR